MISSTTLLLATLVFNAATVLGAPIRIPTAQHAVARAVVDDAVPRAVVIDVQPVQQRSVEGNAARPRFAREDGPLVDARDTASIESVSVRDSLPEVEELVRRFPRKALLDRYLAKRAPEPAPSPSPPSDSPDITSRSTAPEPVRRFARRALFDRHAERSEPAPEARSEPAPGSDPHFVRDENPELFEKRSAPITDNFPREPEPAPAPAPVPQPAPEPEVVKPQVQERRRVYPRKYLADKYEKRQEETSETTEEPAAEPAAETTTTTATTSTPTAATSTPSPTAPGLPNNLDFNKVIADAIVSGTTDTKTTDAQGHKASKYKETKITIQIVQNENSDVKLEPPVVNPTATSTSTSSSSTIPTPTGTSTPTEPTTTTPASPTPTGTGSSPTEEESNSGAPTPTGTPAPTGTGASTDETADKPAAESTEGGAGEGETANAAETSSGSPPGGETAAETADTPAPEERRDLDGANSAAEPVSKRHLGLSGSLLASWTRRNVQQN